MLRVRIIRQIMDLTGEVSAQTKSQFQFNTQQIPQKSQVPQEAVNMELRRKLWEGHLPVKVDLALSDLNNIEAPRSLYIMAPRENYFFFILQEVKSLFDSYAPADKIDAYDEMWFEFNNTPLKWNVPLGVQYDTLIGIRDKQKDLPWCLTFHYKDFPEEQVLRLEGLNFFKFHYINALKESHTLRLGSASEILSMQKKEEQRMIDGIMKHNFENFWEINQPLCDKNIADVKKYALRVFTNRHHTYAQPNIEVYKAKDEPLETLQQDTLQPLTLGDMLADTFPRLFDRVLSDKGEIEIQKMRQFEVVVQGVEAELNTPLFWMQLNLGCLDNFLYVSLHFNNNP